MVSKRFRHSFTIDEEYMPIFVHAFQAVKAHTSYDYMSDVEVIIEEMARETPTITGEHALDRMMDQLVTRGTPLKTMRDAREQLRRRKPKDRRISTLHRRVIRLIDWQERELASVLLLLGQDPTSRTEEGGRAYDQASRYSHAMSERVDHWGRKIEAELTFIYERFPELRPHLAEISGSFGFPSSSTQAEPPPTHSEQSIRLVLEAYERGVELQRLQEWLDQHISLVRYAGAGWFNVYEARPVKAIEEINHELGELWFLLHEFDRLAARVPAAIADGMPTNANRDMVTERWGVAVQDALNDFNGLVASWEHLHTGAISASSPAYRDVHYWTELAGLAAMAGFYADLSATLARWNGNETAAQAWRERGASYTAWGADLMNYVRAALRRLKTEQPARYDALGFTDTMLSFLELDDLIA